MCPQELGTVFYCRNYLKVPWLGAASPAQFCVSTFTCQAQSALIREYLGNVVMKQVLGEEPNRLVWVWGEMLECTQLQVAHRGSAHGPAPLQHPSPVLGAKATLVLQPRGN